MPVSNYRRPVISGRIGRSPNKDHSTRNILDRQQRRVERSKESRSQSCKVKVTVAEMLKVFIAMSMFAKLGKIIVIR